MDAVSEVKGRLSIEDVVGEYVRLKRTGKNFKGLSPWTNEKTPSFVVSPEKQIWHDFSSSRGGDMFTFIQEVEGIDFRGALELLARKAGVDLDKFQPTKSGGQNKEKLLQILELAAKFYQTQLKAKPAALNYLTKTRQFSKQTILDFQLGYSPDNPRSLTDFLLKKKYTERELKLIGVSVERRSGLGDMFRGRIVVPLHDPQGRVVGFTARLLEDNPPAGGGAPKYINTASTPLYDKSRHIFGLHLAKEAIRSAGYSVIAEGNLDVISSHQAGVKQVVATAGTALTELQLKQLGRFSPDVRLAFDTDRAGLAAAERAIPLAGKAGVNLGIITIPAGKDPDELIQKAPKLWTNAIEDSQYAMDWLIEYLQQKMDLTSARGKREFSDEIIKILRGVSDAVERDHYVGRVAELLEVDPGSLRSKLTAKNNADAQILKRIEHRPSAQPAAAQERRRDIDHLLALAFSLPGTRGYLEILTDEMLLTDDQKAILKFLQKNPDFSGNIKELLKSSAKHGASSTDVSGLADYVKILSLQFEELYGTVDTLELQYEAARLRTRIIEYYAREQKTIYAQKLADASESQQRKILAQVHELDVLLSQIKAP